MSFQIIMTTWYQETPKEYHHEVWKNKLFTYMEDACKCLSEDYMEILENFPVHEIAIKWTDILIDDNRENLISKILDN